MTRPSDDSPHDEPARDAWLSEALRHAPDASAAPPAAVSESILRQARNAVKTPQPAAPTHPLMRVWSWLARPQVAGSFATVMVAVLVGMIWWDKPLDETLPPRAAAPAVVPAAVPDAASSSTPVPAPTAVQPPAATTAPAPAAPPQADAARDSVPAPRRATAPTERADKAAAAPPPSARAEAQKKSAPPDEREALRGGAPAPAQAAPTPFPDTAPAAEQRRRESNAAAQQRSESRATDAARDRAGEGAAPKVAAAPAPLAEPALPEASLPRALSKSAAAASGNLRSPLRDDADRRITPTIDQPDRWTWQRGGAVQPMTPALQRWLEQLERAARWRAADSAAPPTAADGVLRLWRDGALRATVQISADAVWLSRPGAPPQMASLTAETASALRAALADAAP